MNKNVQTLTPPAQAILGECNDDGQYSARETPGATSGTNGRKSLFIKENHRCDLLDDYPELAQVCDQLGFGEMMSLAEWSESPEWALLELARAAFPPPPALGWDLSSAALSELIADLIDGHHRPLRNELRRIGILIGHWSRRVAGKVQVDLAKSYQDFCDSLIAHLDQEEAVLFPRCLAIDIASRRPRGSTIEITDVTPAIRAMNIAHDESERSLQQIRKLFDHYTRIHPDPDVAIIRIGLAEMATDLAAHATKESEFLIPAAIFAEDQVRARQGSC